jgi:ATPase subunit of ABC transporter with duplicated ATPase domains
MPPDATSLLDAKGVDAGYGTMQVLWGVDLDVRAGETVLLLGANGAGKTTFLKSLVGLIEARHGRISLGSARRRWAMPIPAAAWTNSMACFRCCATNAGIPRPACRAASAKCWALPRHCRPNQGFW